MVAVVGVVGVIGTGTEVGRTETAKDSSVDVVAVVGILPVVSAAGTPLVVKVAGSLPAAGAAGRERSGRLVVVDRGRAGGIRSLDLGTAAPHKPAGTLEVGVRR